MGQEISSATFCRSDFEQFAKRLQLETDILSDYFADHVFDSSELHLGVELEGCLIDQNCDPAPKSEQLIAGIDNQKIVPELAKYNFEINSKAVNLDPSCLFSIHEELNNLWLRCCQKATELDISAVAIGILPTYQQEMLTFENIYPYQRYYALEEELAKYRHGQPISTHIHGIDDFQENFNSILLEAVTTSLQIHIQVCLSESVRMYNAAQIISAPMIAIAANSPFLFGKNLWCDTRIPIFEQSAAISYNYHGKPTPHKRVTFGHQFANGSLLDLFTENLQDYLILLPEISDEPAELLHHLRLHNGTIWRWNRPLIGMDNPEKPNLRIEHRVNPAGPSIADNIANLAFFLGMLTFFAQKETPPETEISFNDAANNFYGAAKNGLRSKLVWLNNKTVDVSSLVLDELIPKAEAGLTQLGIEKESIDYYLNIIKQRVKKQITGAEWQRKFIAKYGLDFNNMLYHYLDNQTTQQAVHQWKI